MRVTGLIAAALTLVTAADLASGEVPRGRRVVVTPTHVVVAEAPCAVRGASITLQPGAAVEVRAKRRARGAVEVRLAGTLDATCAVDADALGKWVAADAAIEDGVVYEGALVRVLGAGATDGTRRVESLGDVRKIFELPDDALTVEPREFLFRPPATRHFVTPYRDTTLYRKPESVGTTAPPVAIIAGGVEVVLVDQRDAVARVRTHGPVEVEGWALNKQFADRGAEADARLLVPTHEIFTGAELYEGSRGRASFARLRGGALVEVGKLESGRAKVTTVGRAIVSGWVDARELRELAGPSGD